VGEHSVPSPEVIHKENILNNKILQRIILVEQPPHLVLCKGTLTYTTTFLESKKLSTELEKLLKEFNNVFPNEGPK